MVYRNLKISLRYDTLLVYCFIIPNEFKINFFFQEFTNLDLYGNTLYVYVWKTDNEVRVYRCQVMCSDLVAKTHTILLIDYGQKMVVPFIDVRKVTKDLDQSYLIGLSQRAAVYTFLLTGYISKPKSNTQLVNVLCNKYYKYRHDFEIGGISFVSLIDDDKKLIDHGLADTVDVATTFTIANSMVSIIASNNKNDLPNNFPIASKTPTSKSFLMPQHLDCVTLIDVVVTRVSISDNFVLLTVRTIVRTFYFKLIQFKFRMFIIHCLEFNIIFLL